MKVLFINPNWQYLSGDHFPGCKKPHQPLELLYPASILSKNHTVEIIDAFLLNLTDDELLQMIKKNEPDVIIITTAPSYLYWRCCPLDISNPLKISKQIKSKFLVNLIIIGPHATVSPEWVIRESRADFIIRGEPEISLSEFINSEFNNTEITGLFSKTVNNGIAVVENLSQLDCIDFSLLKNNNEYHTHSPNFSKGGSIEFSRGCVFNCSFCFKQMFRGKYRIRPSKSVLNEINQLKKQGVQHIYFIDELFNYDSIELRQFLSELKNLKIKWSCQCRPDIMNMELLTQMKKAGCESIEYGLETLSTKLNKNLKKSLDVGHFFSIIENTIKLEIKTSLFLLYGIPIENDSTLNETLTELLKINKNVNLSSALIIPYPTTNIYKEIVGNSKIITKENWKTCENLIGKTSSITLNRLERFIILIHLDNHLRKLNIPTNIILLINKLIIRLPTLLYHLIFIGLINLKKRYDF